MVKKILVVGGVAGGASAAARARRLDEHAEITIFEKGPHVSFSNCALPYHLSGVVAQAEDIVLMEPAEFQQQYNITALVQHEVIAIDSSAKTVTVLDGTTNRTYTETYDELILATGAKPLLPDSIIGITQPQVFSVRNVPDIVKLGHYLKSTAAKTVTVIGGGFIGLEVAENLAQAGLKTTIVEAGSHVLQTLDDDFSQLVHKTLLDHDVRLITEDSVTEIQAGTVTLASGKTIASDVVVAALGVVPEVTLAVKSGITLGKTGAIKVDQHYQTNLPHVYAVGDVIEVTSHFTGKKIRQNLAFPAQIQARKAVDHIYGRQVRNRNAVGAQVLKLFNLAIASTGLTEAQCRENELDYRAVTIIPKDKVPLMPNARPLHFKLIFSYPDGKILGAQALGESQVDKQIDIIATAIRYDGYVEDLQDLELCYQPLFSTAKNAVNMASLVAVNILNGEYQQVPVTAVRSLVERHAFIIDAREEQEFAEGHLLNAVNIPLSQFRSRLAEIPTDQPVYVHCLSGQRSYNVVRALLQLGYTNVYNISGSFLGISEYEYYRDTITDREKILTAYRFDLLG